MELFSQSLRQLQSSGEVLVLVRRLVKKTENISVDKPSRQAGAGVYNKLMSYEHPEGSTSLLEEEQKVIEGVLAEMRSPTGETIPHSHVWDQAIYLAFVERGTAN